MGSSADKSVYVPILNVKRQYGTRRTNYGVTVAVNNAALLDEASSSAVGMFRNIRGLKLAQENDFEIRKSDGIVEILKENTVMLRSATIAIGLVTLLGLSLIHISEPTRPY